jgi:hypothetical protein
MKLPKYLTIELPDGSIWGVPVRMIAEDRARHYAQEFDGIFERSLMEDTLPLFAEDGYAIEAWAGNNMDWDDFNGHQVKLKEGPTLDFQQAWLNGPKAFRGEEEMGV